MPSIPFYAMAADFPLVVSQLNSDEEIAFLISEGAGRWRAVEQVSELESGRTVLWHTPGGPSSAASARRHRNKDRKPIWGMERTRPFRCRAGSVFGSIPEIVTLDVPRLTPARLERVPISAFGWIGQRYRAAGRPATRATEAWWRRLQRWLASVGVLVQREGMRRGRGSIAYALPEAHRYLEAGMPGELNPPAL
jgi:hypothetical protein